MTEPCARCMASGFEESGVLLSGQTGYAAPSNKSLMAYPRPLNHAASARLSRSVPPSEVLQSVSFLSNRLQNKRQWLRAATACSPRAFIVEMKAYFHSTQHSRSTRLIAKRESVEMLMGYEECQAVLSSSSLLLLASSLPI